MSRFDHRSRGSVEPQPIAADTGQRQLQRVYQAELLYNGRLGRGGAHALDVGTHVTPRVAVRQQVGRRPTLRASAGEGFRAPDFKEPYMRFANTGAGYAVNGNPGLRPETSRNVTAGAEWAGERAYLRTQLYWSRFRDFIETRAVGAPGEPAVYEYANVDDGTTRGADVDAGLTFRDVRVDLVRDDAPVRAEAVRRVRELIELQHLATGETVVVVPVLVSKGSVSRDKVPNDIRGTPSLYAGEPLVPHPAVARWIEARVREGAGRATAAR